MHDLGQELKELIIDCLDLDDVTPADIQDEEPLFVDGLGLDSIDALELGMHIQKKYNVKLDANDKATKEHFASVNALRRFLESEGAAAS